MSDQIPITPSIVLDPSLRRSLYAADRAAWWHVQGDAYREAGDLVWDTRCRNEAAFWEEDKLSLAEMLEGSVP